MLQGKRNEKVATEIKMAVAEAILNDMRDPRIGFVTVTDVDLAPDLRYATVFISILGTEKEKKGTLIALNHAHGFFQKLIADKMNLRFTPKIHFKVDTSIEEGLRIDSILNKIHEEEPRNDAGEDTTD